MISKSPDPVDGLVQWVASRSDAVEGLRAIGLEVGGRSGNRILDLADRLRRGETANRSIASLEPLEQTLLQAASAPANELASRLAQTVSLNRLRADLLRRVVGVTWFALIYGWLGALAGWWLIVGTEEMVTDLILSFELASTEEHMKMLVIWKYFCFSLWVTTSILIAAWMVRNRSPWATRIQHVVSRMPMIGPAVDAIELAGFCESMQRSVEAGWTYSDALRGVVNQTGRASGATTTRIGRWATNGAQRIEAGESMNAVMDDLPLTDNWLAKVSGPVATYVNTTGNGSNQSSSSSRWSEGWQLASERMHEVAIKRTQRVISTVAPLATILSLAVAYTSVGLSFSSFKLLLDTITGWM